jgi:hypothetical protein
MPREPMTANRPTTDAPWYLRAIIDELLPVAPTPTAAADGPLPPPFARVSLIALEEAVREAGRRNGDSGAPTRTNGGGRANGELGPIDHDVLEWAEAITFGRDLSDALSESTVEDFREAVETLQLERRLEQLQTRHEGSIHADWLRAAAEALRGRFSPEAFQLGRETWERQWDMTQYPLKPEAEVRR